MARRSMLRLVPLVAVLATLVLPVGTAGAQTTYEVEVGRFLEGAPAESQRFLPWRIDVHQGDTLHFSSQSFHTATFLPVGEGPVAWFEDLATLGTSQPYALVQPDPDDGPTSYKFGLGAFFPSDQTCGAPGLPACSFAGSSVVNSGVPLDAPLDFSVQVNAGAGSSFYVVCIVHGPDMRLRVDVVASGTPASDPGDLADAVDAAVEQDTDSALALHARFSGARSSHVRPDGTRVWDAWAGVDNGHVALLAMYPQRLRIGVGDRVQWHFDSLTYEDHTVTFPIDRARAIAAGVGIPACDPDGDAGPGPDAPPDLAEPPFCSDPTQLELELHDRFVPPAGNGVFLGRDLESSGVLGANSPLGDGNYVLRFPRASTDGPFKYLCLIHPFMRGKVVVG